MKYLYKRIKSVRENYVDTLGKLYDYSTTFFPHNLHSRFFDAEGGYTYADFKEKCDGLSKKLTQYGIGAGDKVAILSQNMPNWTVALFSIVPFGRISIPILPNSSENEVANILKHSESKVLFVSKKLLPNVSKESLEKMTLVIDIETFEELYRKDEKFTCDGKVAHPMPDDIATILYTSGTTGNAKGVVLSHRNLISCVHTCYKTQKRNSKDRWLSMLPMAHTFELTLGALYPMYVGASVYYLSKPPVASLLLKAMQTVKPTTVLSVPLIMEKIFKNSILPAIKKSPILNWMDRNMHPVLCKIIGFKLKKIFGGHITFFGIGGAKLDPDIENFLLKSGFPYAVGYGLTETSPLLSFSIGRLREPGSVGIPVKGVELKLNDKNPETGEGEIVVKGANVMMGYYKDPRRTRAAFTDDGWFRTNDLAYRDKKGKIFIKGRLNNMILGASGENIYPEEIEKVINDIKDVNESIVMQREGRLIALINFNENVINWNYQCEADFLTRLENYKKTILDIVNNRVNKGSRLSSVEVFKEPFEKTATNKIRRFIYNNQKGI